MTTIPNPATTEWIPLWDLNATSAGSGGTLGPHHVTHEIGGTDIIQNVAWLSQPNIFTSAQTINMITPDIHLNDTSAPVDARLFRIVVTSQSLYFQSTNDAVTIDLGHVTMSRTGVLNAPTGLGTTPLNATQLTIGTVPDARLSTNVPLKNQPNIFTQNQQISGSIPTLKLLYTGTPGMARIFQDTPNSRLCISSNIAFDGANWSADDITAASAMYIQSTGQHYFYISPAGTNPRTAGFIQAVVIDINGVLSVPAGLGGTPLNASNITSGAIPDARLSTNVALKNIDNHFAPQNFASYSGINGPNSWFFLNDTSGPVDGKYWRFVSYSDGSLHLESLNDAVSTILGRVSFFRNNIFYASGGLSSTPLDASQLTSGTVPVARLPPFIDQAINKWIPVIGGEQGEGGQTYNYQQGAYIRTGKHVTLWAYVQFKGPSDGGPVGAKGTINGNLILRNFPFQIGNTLPYGNAPYVAGHVAYYTNLFTPQDITGITLYGGATWNYARFMKLRSGAQNPITMSGADLNDSTQIIATISYFID